MRLLDDAFDDIKPKELTKQDAFAGILMAANASDGHVSDEEVQGFLTPARTRRPRSRPPSAGCGRRMMPGSNPRSPPSGRRATSLRGSSPPRGGAVTEVRPCCRDRR